jgi:hypothetical protein
MTRLEKATAWATIVSPLLIAVLGIWIQRSVADQDADRGYVELAISILKEDRKQQNSALRKWAVQILNEASPVPIDGLLQVQLETGDTKLPMPPEPVVITVK